MDRTAGGARYRQVEVWLKDGRVLRVELLNPDGLTESGLTHEQIDLMTKAVEGTF